MTFKRLSQNAVVFLAADLDVFVFFRRGSGEGVLFVRRSLSVLSLCLLLRGDDDGFSERQVDILTSKKIDKWQTRLLPVLFKRCLEENDKPAQDGKKFLSRILALF